MDTMLWIKRALVWAGSMGLGFVISLAIVYGPMQTDLETYSLTYFIVTWIPLGLIFVIWGDALLGTRILPD
ncbi:MAG: hypothetical protein ACLFTK_02190 [Anaerolineales bacterium]